MWVIFDKSENKNPSPGTLGEEMAIMEWYYDATSLRKIGAKRYVAIQLCAYRRIRFGEPVIRNAKYSCQLQEEVPWGGSTVGIDCKTGKYQIAAGVLASPSWDVIGEAKMYANLKREICAS